jgi:GTP-binding protein
LNEALTEAVTWHAPPTSRGGKQGKVYYCTQISDSPPTIILFVNDTHRFNDNYKRYIENQFRKSLGFEGTPVRFIFRGKKDREVEKSKNSALR